MPWSMRKKISDHFQHVDMRFRDTDEEALFKDELEQVLVRNGVIGYSIFVCLLWPLIPAYTAAVERNDYPFTWSLGDPRTIVFGLRITQFVFALPLVVLGSLRSRLGLFKQWNWEFLFIALTAYTISSTCWCSIWHVATAYGMDPDYVWESNTSDSELVTILSNDAMLTAACLFVPFRACVLWILPASATLHTALTMFIIGSPFPQATIIVFSMFATLTLMAFLGACRQEQSLRAAFRQVVESKEVLRQQEAQLDGMKAVATALCDAVVALTEDLCVVGSEPMHRSFFGRDIEGASFTDILHEKEKDRFKEQLVQASTTQAPVCVHTTLRRGSKTSETKMLLVSSYHMQQRYLIGICVDEAEQLVEREEPTVPSRPVSMQGSVCSSTTSTSRLRSTTSRTRNICTTISEDSVAFGIDDYSQSQSGEFDDRFTLYGSSAFSANAYLAELERSYQVDRSAMKLQSRSLHL